MAQTRRKTRISSYQEGGSCFLNMNASESCLSDLDIFMIELHCSWIVTCRVKCWISWMLIFWSLSNYEQFVETSWFGVLVSLWVCYVVTGVIENAHRMLIVYEHMNLLNLLLVVNWTPVWLNMLWLRPKFRVKAKVYLCIEWHKRTQ